MNLQAAPAAPAEKKDSIRLHPFTLQFQGKFSPLEAGFRNQEREVNVPQTRFIILVAILLFSSFGFYDISYHVPALEHRLLFIRFILTVPMMFLYLTWSGHGSTASIRTSFNS